MASKAGLLSMAAMPCGLMMLALGGAFIASLTFVPAMVALLIRGKVAEKEVKAVAWIKHRYEPVLRRIVARPWPWIGAGVGTFVLAGLIFTMLGREFIPTLDEGDLVIEIRGIPSMSLAIRSWRASTPPVR